jgi:hypothetical protein
MGASRTPLAGLLASMSGATIGDRDYLGFFTNQHGEWLVFIQQPGQPHALLLHSDMDWAPEQIHPDSLASWAPGAARSSPPAQKPMAGNVILDQAEATWLAACLDASAWTRGE